MKATYSLDEETARMLERLARRPEVSKSEALRRAIRCLANADSEAGAVEVAALQELQRRLDLTPGEAEAWTSRVREERVASSRG